MYWLYRACAGVILLSKDVGCWHENPVTLSATELFIHWFRPNFSDLVYNGHQGPDTFTPDRNLQLLWFQVGIHPLNIPEKGGKGDVESFLFWYQSCSCGCAWQIFHINNFLLPRSIRFERLYSVWFCFSARSEFPTEIGFWGFWIGGLSFVIRRSRSGQRRWRFARVPLPCPALDTGLWSSADRGTFHNLDYPLPVLFAPASSSPCLEHRNNSLGRKLGRVGVLNFFFN